MADLPRPDALASAAVASASLLPSAVPTAIPPAPAAAAPAAAAAAAAAAATARWLVTHKAVVMVACSLMGLTVAGARSLKLAAKGAAAGREQRRGRRSQAAKSVSADSSLKDSWASKNTSRVSMASTGTAASGSPENFAVHKHAKLAAYTVGGVTYPQVRVVHRQRLRAGELSAQLPLLVFLHGLGGQLTQFEYLLDFNINITHCLAIDLPGCGASAFAPRDWSAYTTDALCALVAAVVRDHLHYEGQQVVLIGHSMGCALAVKLATAGGLLSSIAAGVIAICPKVEFTEKERAKLASAANTCDFIFDLYRKYDRWGGTHSHSVDRQVAPQASEQARVKQLRYNRESRTPVWRRMVKGLQLPTREEWLALACPLGLLAAEKDGVAPPAEIDRVAAWFADAGRAADVVHHEVIANAGHGLMYEAPFVLINRVSACLRCINADLDYAAQNRATCGKKWEMKNLEKWISTQCVSPRIQGRPRPGAPMVVTPFRPMKTLRNEDGSGHSPEEFSRQYPDVSDVIDLTHDDPNSSYDPGALEGIRYHKHSIVSKEPPSRDQIAGFVALVDGIRARPDFDDSCTIAIHCHYGFNRTGFFLVSYMVERLGFGVNEAIDAFKASRPPGIRHANFLNELHARYPSSS